MKAGNHNHTDCTLPVWGVRALVAISSLSLSFADTSNLELRSLEEKVETLTLQNQKLKDSLVKSNYREEQYAAKLTDIKKRLGALGKSLLSEEKDARIISALSEVEFLNDKLNTVEASAVELIENYRDFSSSALVSSPDTRNRLEASIRKAETALGYRHKPARQVATGILQQAKVVSIDQESGLLVLNVGQTKDARIGMRFAIKRGSLDLATGIIAEVRPSVSGLLVEKVHENLPIQNGDTAKVLLN